MSTERIGYGAAPDRASDEPVVAIADAAALLVETVTTLQTRAAALVADAARELGSERLALVFGDGSRAHLHSQHNTLVISRGTDKRATVECRFDDESLRRLFDLEWRPVDVLKLGDLDIRGRASSVLAAWRTFRLLAQRASGLRVIQTLWVRYRTARGLGVERSPGPERPPPSRHSPIPDAASLLRGTEAVTARSASVATTRVLWDGRTGAGWWTFPGPKDADLFDVLDACRRRVAQEIKRLIPDGAPQTALYDLMREYPDRGGKGLRPTLCMAACGAFGGRAEDAVRTAAAVEMFHNAFLIHDDIEDESSFRRGEACLHSAHGVPLAINAGDGLNLAAIDAVLGNIESLGLARTLALISEVIHMCKETIEGQAMELSWIRRRMVPQRDADYVRMVTKKTGWYTCMSPSRLGAIAAGHVRARELDLVAEAFCPVGVAFQIQDDVLNLVGAESLYGKESLGDLLEGKRTLMLIHLQRTLGIRRRREVAAWLALPRREKDLAGARWVCSLMEREGSIEHGRATAARYAAESAGRFEQQLAFLPESEPKAILRQVIHYANTRML
jgi:geranylgeranyl diphosphate synthase type II